MNYFRIKENSLPARLAARKLKSRAIAMVLGHTIHLYGTTKAEFLFDERWVRHELKHIEEYERYGVIRFLYKYILQTIRCGYYKCALEQEARAAENDPSIIARFRLKDKKTAWA